MGINLSNFLTSKSKNTRMIDFQDLDHIDGCQFLLIVQIYIMIVEMIYQCFILEMEQTMHLFTLNQK